MPSQIPSELRLYRGGALLGTIIPTPEEFDFPWFAGTFTPSGAFESVRPLFERELILLNDNTSDQQWDAWDDVWNEISHPGLQILDSDGAVFTSEPLIHIEISKARWR